MFTDPKERQIYEVGVSLGVHFFRLHYGGSVDSTLKLWDLTIGTELKTLTGHTVYINAIAITWDGQRALCADERKWGGDRYFQHFAAPLPPME